MTNKSTFFLGGEPAAIQLEDIDYVGGTPAVAYSNIGTLVLDVLHRGVLEDAAYCIACKDLWLDPATPMVVITLPRYMVMAKWNSGNVWGFVCAGCAKEKDRGVILSELVVQLGGVPTESVTLVGGTA